MVLEAKLIGFKLPKFISLPNIMLDRTVVPELIQDGATAQTMRESLKPLMEDSEARDAQLQAFAEIDSLLGRVDAITQTASLAFELLDI